MMLQNYAHKLFCGGSRYNTLFLYKEKGNKNAEPASCSVHVGRTAGAGQRGWWTPAGHALLPRALWCTPSVPLYSLCL
jgi:hypothetical protein